MTKTKPMRTHILFSHKYDEWETPDDLFYKLSEKYGPFTMDVAASIENSKCPFFCSKTETYKDGLTSDWSASNWCNPPYSLQKQFVLKAMEESKKGKKTVMLLPARTDTRLFHDYLYKKENVEIEFIKGRVKFINPTGGLLRGTKMNGSNDAAPFPSMVVIIKALESHRRNI